MLRKKIFLVFFTAMALTACNRDNVKISGAINGADKQKVYFIQLNVDDNTIVDSTTTGNNGQFSLSTNIEQPTFFKIKVNTNADLTLLARPDSKFEITGDMVNFADSYIVKNSKEGTQDKNAMLIKEFNLKFAQTKHYLDSLENIFKKFDAEDANAVQRQNIILEWDSIYNEQLAYSRNFVTENAISTISYYALYQKLDTDNYILSPETDLHSYKVVATALQALYPESQYTKAILKHLDQINDNIKTNNLMSLINSSETTLPDIALPNVNGDIIKLLSLKSKYVILDFTVLRSQGGLKHTEELKKIYQKYKRNGVEIYQVCLDEDERAWKILVQRNNITWTCVRDSSAMYSKAAQLWNVKELPANYIITQDANIVGKNLYGSFLSERLEDLFNQ